MPPWEILKSQTLADVFSCILRSIFILLCCPQKSTNLNKLGRKKLNIYSNRFPNNALIIDEKKRNVISKFDHRMLALTMSSTNVGKNRYHPISLILTLEQNILITITSWQPLIFILSSHGFQLMPCTFLRFETFITRRFNWALLQLLHFKRWDTRQNVLSFTFAFCFL